MYPCTMVVKLCKISTTGLIKKYRINSKTNAINSISVSIEKPGIYALVGPNGAGKTTLLKLLAGILHKTSGTLDIIGSAFYFPEISAYYSNLSALDHYNLIANICEMKQIIHSPKEILSIVGLPKDKLAKDFSKGMKRRLDVGMGLMIKTDILLMDEPFDGLDPSIAEDLSNIIKEANNGHRIIIISSHDLTRVGDISDSIIFMKSGKIVSQVNNGNERNTIVIVENSDDNRKKLSNLNLIYRVKENNIHIEIKQRDLSGTVKIFDNLGIEIKDIKILNMLDLYRDIIGGNFDN